MLDLQENLYHNKNKKNCFWGFLKMDIEKRQECAHFYQHYVRARNNFGYGYRKVSCGHCAKTIRGRFLPCKADCAYFERKEQDDEKLLFNRAEHIQRTLEYLLPQVDILIELLKKTSS